MIPKRTFRDVEAEYRGFATRGLEAINGREGFTDRTRAMISLVLELADFRPGQRVLDIGCGTGLLLSRLPHAAERAGTVLTAEEKEHLDNASNLAGIQFCVASFDNLSAVEGKFDRIVVNSAIHFTKSEAGAYRALTNITAMLAPGGKLWLGELLAKDFRRREFQSKLKAFRYVQRRHGIRFSMAFARHVIRHWPRADHIVYQGPRLWHVTPEQMPMLAKRFGLEVESIWNCEAITGDPFYAMQERFSVLLSRP
jgi:ubiquinone/menaquinone biosynthesis C-methylase UbiE